MSHWFSGVPGDSSRSTSKTLHQSTDGLFIAYRTFALSLPRRSLAQHENAQHWRGRKIPKKDLTSERGGGEEKESERRRGSRQTDRGRARDHNEDSLNREEKIDR
eukprot:1690173-Rhodomonas_salina.2